MRTAKMHIGVFFILIVVAAGAAFMTPLSVDPRDVFLIAILAFFLYLGIHYVVSARTKE